MSLKISLSLLLLGSRAGDPKISHNGVLFWIEITWEAARTGRALWLSFVSLNSGNKSHVEGVLPTIKGLTSNQINRDSLLARDREPIAEKPT